MNLPKKKDVRYDCGHWIGYMEDEQHDETCPKCEDGQVEDVVVRG